MGGDKVGVGGGRVGVGGGRVGGWMWIDVGSLFMWSWRRVSKWRV